MEEKLLDFEEDGPKIVELINVATEDNKNLLAISSIGQIDPREKKSLLLAAVRRAVQS